MPYVAPEEEQIDVAQIAREIQELEQQHRKTGIRLAAMLSRLYPDMREAIEASFLPKDEDSPSVGAGDN